MLAKKAGLISGIVIPGLILWFADFAPNSQITAMAAIAVMMSIFWLTEAIPLAATALLPLVFFPILGVASSKATASQYMNSTVFLLIGGFMIALAMQKWNLHKRIAINILVFSGKRPFSLVSGFMVATASLSMWISNTATTLVILPIAMAVIVRCQDILPQPWVRQFSIGLLLSIAYSASIGGMMTLVGSAPNLVFARAYQLAAGDSIGFLQWMIIALPIGLLLLLLLALIIYVVYLHSIPRFEGLVEFLREEKRQLGPISFAERVVIFIFVMTAGLWISRKGIEIGSFVLPGWAQFLPFGDLIDDGSIAISMAVILFFIPAKPSFRTGGNTILDEKVFTQLPWAVVVLFGGGFALAFGFSESGLSVYLAEQLTGMKGFLLFDLVLAVTAGMSLLTELTSNTATSQLVMPILASTSKAIGFSPAWLMLPAVLASSCAFMFPVATPPNAIIFGTGQLKVTEMMKVGFILNCMAIVIISGLSYFLIPVGLLSQ